LLLKFIPLDATFLRASAFVPRARLKNELYCA
jgi:hypothetical protein